MNKPTKDIVACESCLAEIPASEAKSDEATDYVMHFCGLECHQKWRETQDEKQERPTDD